jgi:hypothetical protein
LKVTFLKGLRDNPKINAILIIKGDIMETEYAERKKKLIEENQKKIQKMKMKSLLVKKHDVDEEFDEEYELSTEEDVILVKYESTIISTLLSPAGTYIVVSFLVFLALYFTLENMEQLHIPKKSKVKTN